jgi:hypothetical protein
MSGGDIDCFPEFTIISLSGRWGINGHNHSSNELIQELILNVKMAAELCYFSESNLSKLTRTVDQDV